MANGVSRLIRSKNAIENGSQAALAKDQLNANEVAKKYKQFPARDIKNKHNGTHLN